MHSERQQHKTNHIIGNPNGELPHSKNHMEWREHRSKENICNPFIWLGTGWKGGKNLIDISRKYNKINTWTRDQTKAFLREEVASMYDENVHYRKITRVKEDAL